ncbi:ATP-binding protein [Pseudoalteromonas sp. SG44-17]|uniref:ATP-binding protein n=1 Tax=Pseudoalteromonas sp. SG44-17 TaxID=2760963 RepID=UPI0016028316|nr:ATP-binding protein [Pseudoalteromonas sp. SG44-17]MBB1411648.1 ATP-binding protein [Pseudoalteromonas sp. SG44-17]
MENRFLSGSTVIDSLRDNGYKNSAYALAELIDNSLQAEATRVELGFIESKKDTGAKRATYTVDEITLWDNGLGMLPEVLRTAMQFGGGHHRNEAEGMGKFGMGLPNSSISQCKRVDVWSWREGELPHHTYLDIDEMKEGILELVPEPKMEAIPSKYKDAFFSTEPTSGTLVVWSKLDRLSWKTGKSIYKHCEYLVGRMYRNFIYDEKIKIESKIYRADSDNTISQFESSMIFKANDPMYLLKNTSLPELPEPYKSEAFFELHDEKVIEIDVGRSSPACVNIRTSVVKASIAKQILTESKKSELGSTPFGQHCKRNIGVSIVRAGRELVIRDSFFTSGLRESKGRFIGVEVSFSPLLDEFFGVTNNKQDAVKLIPYDLEDLISQVGFVSEQEFEEDLIENNDPLIHALKVAKTVKKMISEASDKLKTVTLEYNSPSQKSRVSPSEIAATNGSKHREENGHNTEEYDEPFSGGELDDFLRGAGVDNDETKARASDAIINGTKFLIECAPRDSDAFFDVATRKSLTLVIFNTNHIFFKKLVNKLNEEEKIVMETAIAGFARVMNETSIENRVEYLNQVRREWGKMITEFLEEPHDDCGTF